MHQSIGKNTRSRFTAFRSSRGFLDIKGIASLFKMFNQRHTYGKYTFKTRLSYLFDRKMKSPKYK